MTQPFSAAPRRLVPDVIVVGADGSPSSTDALAWAVRQASISGASVEAVMCWLCPPSSGTEISVLDGDWAADADATLTLAIDQVPGGALVRIRPTVIQGRAADVLVTRSASAHLLVVGSRGHGAVAGMLLGSVSRHVISHARCPVVVVKPVSLQRHPRWPRPRSSVASTAT